VSAIPRLLGMVHLLPLPGAPGFGGSIGEVIETAVSDASVLAEAGFPALMVENFGDMPFFADSVPPETVSSMAVAVKAVLEATGLPLGVNVLRNDGFAALGIAAATGSGFVRVNVLSGMMHTDQGPIVGRAAELLRTRQSLSPDVEIWADLMVKHAAPPWGIDARQAASDIVERGLADAVIVSGSGTGNEPDVHDATVIRAAIPAGTRLVVGSGANVENLGKLMDVADTVIVGSAIKTDGIASNRVDRARAAAFAEKAAEHGLV
jgi:uncharacterized protein